MELRHVILFSDAYMRKHMHQHTTHMNPDRLSYSAMPAINAHNSRAAGKNKEGCAGAVGSACKRKNNKLLYIYMLVRTNLVRQNREGLGEVPQILPRLLPIFGYSSFGSLWDRRSRIGKVCEIQHIIIWRCTKLRVPMSVGIRVEHCSGCQVSCE